MRKLLAKLARRLLMLYFTLIAIATHIGLYYLYQKQPAVVLSAVDSVMQSFTEATVSKASPPTLQSGRSSELSDAQLSRLLQQEINTNFYAWQPRAAATVVSGIWLDGSYYSELEHALKHIKDHSHLRLSTGIYTTPMQIRAHNVTIEGVGHVVLQHGTIAGKGMILAQGNHLTVKNIECRHIKVPSKNGACIRLEGQGLNLEHVYFHSSETALLETAKQHGHIRIQHSRFENLGLDARAHSIYLNSASLHLTDSLILANRHQHSLKTRGPLTVIERSIIASLSAKSSRLLDISNGGELVIRRSLLQQGQNAVNNQAIGFGLEGLAHPKNSITFSENVFLLERPTANVLLHSGNTAAEREIVNNLIIGATERYPDNQQMPSRASSGLAAYPALPAILCDIQQCFK